MMPPPIVDSIAEADEVPEGDRQFVVALERGLRVLRSFASAHESLSNGDLARRTALAKPTITRLTYTLSRLGYLRRDPMSGHYRLGPGTLSLGYASLSKLDARQVARPFMQAMAEHARASVALCARDGLTMIYLEMRRSPRALGLGLDIGDRVPLATSGVGRAYLAALDDAERRPLLDEIRRCDLRSWPKVRKGIEQAVLDVGARGFAVSLGEWLPEIHSTGVPLRVRSAYGALAFNIGGLASSLPARTIERDLGPRLVAMARKVEAMLMASQPADAHTPARSRRKEKPGAINTKASTIADL